MITSGDQPEGWIVQEHYMTSDCTRAQTLMPMESNGREGVTGQSIRGGVLGWYLPSQCSRRACEESDKSKGKGGGADEEGGSGQDS